MDFQEEVALAPFTTLKIGGPARWLARVRSEAELVEAMRLTRERGLPWFVLGGGSNLVVPDAGYPGVVVRVEVGSGIVEEPAAGGVLLHVDAGVDWDGFVLETCRRGLSGVECLAGIPGLVGGSPIQNIGAYGQEVATTIAAVRALDLERGEFVWLTHAECGFAYRTSVFNTTARGRYIVTRVSFFFAAGARPNLTYADLAGLRDREPSAMEVYDFVRAVRARKGMLIDPGRDDPDARSAGSFFKNPVVPSSEFQAIFEALGVQAKDVPHWPVDGGGVKLAAAWLIERAGFAKGFALGPVGISTKHTLALVNRSGSATCAELMELRAVVADRVKERFGVWLEMEPILMR